MKRKISSLLLVFLVFLLTNSAVFAGEGEKELRVKDFPLNAGWGLLEPIQGMVSAPVYLKIKGLDPSSINSGELQGSGLANQAAGAGGLYPARSPSPSFSRNRLVTQDFGIPLQTEPHIAVNPKDPDHLVISAIEYALPYDSAYVTFDGGETWTGPRPVSLHRETIWAGDPTVAFDREGRVFSTFMGIGEEKSYKIADIIVDVPMSNISVARSEDGGLNWQEAVLSVESGFGFFPDEEKMKKTGRLEGAFGFSFLDKPWMSIGPDPLDPKSDIIYITYTEFVQVYLIVYLGELPVFNFVYLQTTILMVASRDGGMTWSEPIAISEGVEGFSQDEVFALLNWRVVQGSQPAVAQDGTVYIAWYDSTKDGSGEGKAEIYVRVSKDGEVFGEPVLAAEFMEGPDRPRTATFRNPSYFPQMAVGREKEVYIVFAAKTNGKPTDDGDIYFVRSLNGAKNFDKPKRLSQDKTNQLQFFPAIAVDPKGNLHVMWGDMQDDPKGLQYHIYYTQSQDRGKSWGFDLPERAIHEPSTRVTDFASNPNKGFPGGRFIGDYYAIAASEKDVYLVWTDSRLGEYGGINQKIGFARRKAIASPEVSLSPSRGPGGQEVTLLALNFQADMNIYIQVGGSIRSAGRTNEEGRITYKLSMPVISEGTYDILVFDDSGNTAQASFYIDFGFSDLAKQDSKVLQQVDETMKESLNELQAKVNAKVNGILLGLAGVLATVLVLFYVVIRRQKKMN